MLLFFISGNKLFSSNFGAIFEMALPQCASANITMNFIYLFAFLPRTKGLTANESVNFDSI